jgi:hypothetical protein
MPEEKKSGITIDAADITRETIDGISGIVPILEKHPKGTLALLVLLTLGGGIAIAIALITHQPHEEKKAPPQSSESGAVKKIDGEDGQDKVFEIKN